MRADTDDYLNLFLNDVPLMDVRAEIEVAKGAFPNSENRPILDDQQRHLIGKRYKDAGQDEAIKLGLELATDEIRAQRLASWSEFCRAHPDGYLFCFRGGLRSRTTQQWLREAGVDYPLVKGGYKAMRRFLIDQLDESLAQLRLISIAGPTGAGKTRVLKLIEHHVDFEGLAQHRGSAFGRNMFDTQPSNIDWENAVSIAMLKHRYAHPQKPLFIEDEGKLIGRVGLPLNLQAAMAKNELILLEEGIEHRLEITLEDYIRIPWREYCDYFGDLAEQKFSAFVLESLARIKKRLGGERYGKLVNQFEAALENLFASGDDSGFVDGIRTLLVDYYDPMYQYQLSKREGRIIFKGDSRELVAWANAQ